MDRKQASHWLDRYIEAWQSYDRRLIEGLFTEDAQYRYHPYEGPVKGREAIARSWLEERDDPNTYRARYAPVAVDGDTVVATGTSTYLAADGSAQRVYDNCFVMSFDGEGRCSEFTEWYVKRPS